MIINTISNSNTCIGICRNSSRKHLLFRSGIISRIITGIIFCIITGIIFYIITGIIFYIITGIIFYITICISSSSPTPSSLSPSISFFNSFNNQQSTHSNVCRCEKYPIFVTLCTSCRKIY